jgi:SAM-dependent methyltransferase
MGAKVVSLSSQFVQRVSTPEFLARVDWLRDNDPRFSVTNILQSEEPKFLTWCHAVGVGMDHELATCIPPIPPHPLREVTGYKEISFYFYHGLAHAQRFAQLFDRHRRLELDRPVRALEFGAGAGRTGRYMGSHPEIIFRGTDINPRAVEWCNRHLPGSGYETSTEDALGYSSLDQLDFIYAYSVFTHLPVEAAMAWLSRLTQRLNAGGVLVFTTQSEQVLELETSQAHRDLYQLTREQASSGHDCISNKAGSTRHMSQR